MRKKLRVLLLGGTGSIGGAVADVLQQRGHRVTCLARSKQSQTRLEERGFATLRGDICDPDPWIDCADRFDAVIQAAATWSDDMGQIDHQLVRKFLTHFATGKAEKTLIYTDGCWSYGATGDHVATETSPYAPLSGFDLSNETARLVTENRNLRGMVILPAMVFERDGGILDMMVADARRGETIRIIGAANTRWPLVHRVDLANLYALMLEKGQAGHRYNGAGIVSESVGNIARVLGKRYGVLHGPTIVPVAQALQDMTSNATGYALDQQMSSEKAMSELGWAPEHTDILAELA